MRRAGTAVSDPSDRVLAYVRGDSMGRVTQVASNPPPRSVTDATRQQRLREVA